MKPSSLDIKTKLFSAYREYISNSYPKDPNVYVIRANPKTVQELLRRGEEYQVNISGYSWATDGKERFLAFRLKSDLRLPPGDLIFGPETVDIKME